MKLRLLSVGFLVMSFSMLVAENEIKIERGLVFFPWSAADQLETGADFDSFINAVKCVDDNTKDEQLQNANEFLRDHNMLLVINKSSFFFIKNNCPIKIPSAMSHIKWLPNINLDSVKSQLNFENRQWDLDLKTPEHFTLKISEYINLRVLNYLAIQVKKDEVGKVFQEMRESLQKVSAALKKIEMDHEDEDYSHLQQPPSWVDWVSAKLRFW